MFTLSPDSCETGWFLTSCTHHGGVVNLHLFNDDHNRELASGYLKAADCSNGFNRIQCGQDMIMTLMMDHYTYNKETLDAETYAIEGDSYNYCWDVTFLGLELSDELMDRI